MSVYKLKQAIIKKENITRQAVEGRAARLKNKYGPFSDEVAYGILAQKAGVDVASIIAEDQTLANIRTGLDRIAILENEKPPPKPKTIITTKTVKIGNNLSLTDPILSEQVIKDAQEMTAVYAEIYIFENSVRETINRALSNNIGEDWWETSAPQKTRENAQNRIEKEKRNAWHGRRGKHPIYYTDISDLKAIIQRHWDFFKSIFPNQAWVNVRLDEIELSRNIVDHHNPLKDKDRKRLEIYVNDWQSQINSHKDSL
ncbi:MAG: Swt1 family HEPN domain-containing protein [Candidatus Heimdallarchaeota archaeon]|nr:Swt1 family HEPN domain-containing protein [Anaerolineae bacterium]MDH5647525.1 Swt1 family HEPN domain-containing protein [Candidatus Heimdallarchaeota archaeon]